MLSGAIKDIQESFCLRPSSHQGKMIWKVKNGLIHAVIVGRDYRGNLFIVCNDPETRTYKLRELRGFDDAYCYHQEVSFSDDLSTTTQRAFELLLQFNEHTDSTYRPSHRFVIPQISAPDYTVSISSEVGHVAYDFFKIQTLKETASNTVIALRLALGLVPKRTAETKLAARKAMERRLEPNLALPLRRSLTA